MCASERTNLSPSVPAYGQERNGKVYFIDQMSVAKPTSLALIICDTVIDDRETNKKTLVGIFNNISAQKVPCRHPELHVFVSLTDGHGVYRTKLECRHRESGARAFEVQTDIKCEDPNQVVEINFALQGVVFQQYGIHNFDLYCDDQLIISRRFAVSPKKV